jgi:hypothetical protein
LGAWGGGLRQATEVVHGITAVGNFAVRPRLTDNHRSMTAVEHNALRLQLAVSSICRKLLPRAERSASASRDPPAVGTTLTRDIGQRSCHAGATSSVALQRRRSSARTESAQPIGVLRPAPRLKGQGASFVMCGKMSKRNTSFTNCSIGFPIRLSAALPIEALLWNPHRHDAADSDRLAPSRGTGDPNCAWRHPPLS